MNMFEMSLANRFAVLTMCLWLAAHHVKAQTVNPLSFAHASWNPSLRLWSHTGTNVSPPGKVHTNNLGILIPNNSPFTEDGVVYNISYFSANNLGRARIVAMRPQGDDLYIKGKSLFTESIQRTLTAYSSQVPNSHWYDVPVKMYNTSNSYTDYTQYLKVLKGYIIGIQFEGQYKGHWEPQIGACSNTAYVVSISSNQLQFSHIDQSQITKLPCELIHHSIAYVPIGTCLKLDLTYEYGGQENIYSYNIIPFNFMTRGNDPRCFQVFSPQRLSDDKEPIVEFSVTQRPQFSYEEAQDDGTISCSLGGFYIYDGLYGRPLYNICSDTELEYGSVYSISDAMTVVYQPGHWQYSSLPGEVVEFSMWAGNADDVPDGYYSQFESSDLWWKILLGVVGVLILITACAVCMMFCNNNSKPRSNGRVASGNTVVPAVKKQEVVLPKSRSNQQRSSSNTQGHSDQSYLQSMPDARAAFPNKPNSLPPIGGATGLTTSPPGGLSSISAPPVGVAVPHGRLPPLDPPPYSEVQNYGISESGSLGPLAPAAPTPAQRYPGLRPPPPAVIADYPQQGPTEPRDSSPDQGYLSLRPTAGIVGPTAPPESLMFSPAPGPPLQGSTALPEPSFPAPDIPSSDGTVPEAAHYIEPHRK